MIIKSAGIQAILLIAVGYLLGSVPTSYLAGRWVKNLDLRQYGSGTVSGSGVWEHVSRWLIVPVGLIDIGKGALPAWLGLQLGLGLPVATAAGLAAVVGHNWPVLLRFHGGRGLGTFIGLLLVIFPWGFPWVVAFLALGWILGDSAPVALASIVTLPALAYFLGGPVIVLPACAAMLVVTLIKRLEANRRPLPPPGPGRRRVILLRLVCDRDIANHAQWLARKPGKTPTADAPD
jgi:glycerol-3-phosphate acyltransferase PlsY